MPKCEKRINGENKKNKNYFNKMWMRVTKQNNLYEAKRKSYSIKEQNG